jgi:hypothetical protein
LYERFLYDNMRLTINENSPNANTLNAQQNIIIPAGTTHPLAAGLTGTIQVFSAPADLVWGAVSAGGVVVATTAVDAIPGGAVQLMPTLFAYEQGAVMQSGFAAAGNRVGYFMPNNGAGSLTANGILLVDAAINQALAR